MTTLNPSLTAIQMVILVKMIATSAVASRSATTVQMSIFPEIPKSSVRSNASILNYVVISSSRLLLLFIFGFNTVRVPSTTACMMTTMVTATMKSVPIQALMPRMLSVSVVASWPFNAKKSVGVAITVVVVIVTCKRIN